MMLDEHSYLNQMSLRSAMKKMIIEEGIKLLTLHFIVTVTKRYFRKKEQKKQQQNQKHIQKIQLHENSL